MTGKRWLVTLIVTLTACTPSTPPASKAPLTGTITLKYTGKSPADGGLEFALDNGTSHSIYYRGVPEPREWDVSCGTPSNGAAGFFSGFADPPSQVKDVEVASGTGVKFTLDDFFKTTHGACQLNLKLTDGTTLHSAEFTH